MIARSPGMIRRAGAIEPAGIIASRGTLDSGMDGTLKNVASIAAWWHERDARQAPGSPVAVWPSHREGLPHLTQATETARLTRRAGYLESDGVDDLLNAALPIGADESRYVFIRGTDLLPVGGNGNEGTLGDLIGPSGNVSILSRYNSSLTIAHFLSGPGGSAPVSVGSAWPYGGGFIFEFGASESEVTVANLLTGVRETAPNTGGLHAVTTFLLGSAGYNAGHTGFKEIIVLSGPSAQDLATVYAYLLKTDKLANIPDLHVWRADARTYQTENAVTPAMLNGEPVRSWLSNKGRKFSIYSDTLRPSLSNGFVLLDGVDDVIVSTQTRPAQHTMIVRIKLTNVSLQQRFFYVNYTGVGINSGDSKVGLVNEGAAWDPSPEGPAEFLDSVQTFRIVRTDPTHVYLYRNGVLISRIIGAQATDMMVDKRLVQGGYAAIAYAGRVLTDEECSKIESEFSRYS